MCAANIGCKQNLSKVYDSWRTGDDTTDAKEAVANYYIVVIPEVEQQKDGSSCGVYTLAHAGLS